MIVGVSTAPVDELQAQLLGARGRWHRDRAGARGGRRHGADPPQPRAAGPGGRHGPPGLEPEARLGPGRPRRAGARGGRRRAHRGRPGRPRDQHHARQRRVGPARPPGERDAGAPVRRRRQPRAAHAAGLDPRLRRADPPRDRAGAADRHPRHRPGGVARRCGCRSSSRTCCCSPGSTPGRPLEREPVDLSLLAVNAVSDAHAAAPDHTWELDLPEDPVEVPGDQARLHQILANLLANARTHTPAGTHVVTRVRPEGRLVRVSVTDDGPGVPESLQPQDLRAVHPRRRRPGAGQRVDRARAEHRRGRRPGPRRSGRGVEPARARPPSRCSSPPPDPPRLPVRLLRIPTSQGRFRVSGRGYSQSSRRGRT